MTIIQIFTDVALKITLIILKLLLCYMLSVASCNT
jgi:hypothetical protein